MNIETQQIPLQKNAKSAQLAIFITVLFGFISYSLPYPIFSPLFLSPSQKLLPADTTELVRTIILGFAIIMYPLGQFLGNPLIGRAADQYGAKKVLMLTLVGTAIGDYFVGWGIQIHSLTLVLISLFFGGFWSSNTTIAQATAAHLSSAETKTKHFSSINVATNLGWVLGCIFGGKLADNTIVSWFNYSTPFYFAVVCYGINLIAVYFAYPNYRIPSKIKSTLSELFLSFITQVKKKNLSTLYLYSFLGFTASYFFFCFLSVYMVQKFNFGPSKIANFEAYLAIPLILANYFLPKLLPRFGLASTSYISYFLYGISLLIFIVPQSPHAMWFTIPIVAVWLTFGEVTSALLISNAVPPEEQGIAMGTYRALLVLGEIMAALTGGLLTGINTHLPFIAATFIATLASLILFIYSKKLCKL